MNRPGLLAACISLAPLLILAACTPGPQPTERAGGSFTIEPFTTGPDTMMRFTMGPDTMGAVPETLWIIKKDSLLTIKFTALPPTGPDTMMTGKGLRVIARRLTHIAHMNR